MSKIFKTLAVAAVVAACVSCQKEQPADPQMSIEEQLAYMDSAGEEALSQIKPSDFKKLAGLVNYVRKDTAQIKFDEKSQTALTLLAASLLKTEGSEIYLLIDSDKINGTVTIEGNVASYTSGSGKKVIFKAGTNTYSADLDITSGSRKVKVGTYRLSTGMMEQDVDIYLLVPTAVSVDVYCNSELYMGADLSLDASGMPSDWSMLTIPQINASASGSLFIAGKGSYRADIRKFGMADCRASLDGTLYGNKGEFLADVKGAADVPQDGGIQGGLDFKSSEFYVNLIQKVAFSTNSGSDTAEFYLDNSTSPQFTVNPGAESVVFSDGTRKDIDEVFNEQNFPKTLTSAMIIYMQFAAMFK